MKIGFFTGKPLFTWLTAIFFVFYIAGYETGNYNYYLSAGMVFLYGGYFLLQRKNFTEHVFKSAAFKCFIIFLLLYFYYLSIFGSGTMQYVVAQILALFPLTAYLFFERDKEQIRAILYIIIAAWVFYACRAYYMFSNDLVAARNMASWEVNENVFVGGGYGLAVASSILAVFLFEMLLWKNVKKHKILIAAFIVLLGMVIYETYSTITMLAFGIGIVSALLFRICGVKTLKKISIVHLFFLVIIVLLVVLFFLYEKDIGEFILKNTFNAKDVFSKRIREIGIVLTEFQSAEVGAADLSNRMERIRSSWQLFLENPFFGITYKYGADSYVLSYYGLGSHGELADIFAKFGLIGGLPYIGMYFFTFLKERRMQRNNIGFGYLVTFAILFYFNPFVYNQSTLIVFFILPAITYLYNSDAEYKNAPELERKI